MKGGSFSAKSYYAACPPPDLLQWKICPGKDVDFFLRRPLAI